MTIPQNRRSVAASSLIVMTGLGCSAMLGFGLQVILAHYYGTRAEMDVFLNASTVPTVLFGGLNFALAVALIPTFSEYLSQGKRSDVRRLGSTVINAVFLLMSLLAIAGWLLAPIFVPVIARGFPAAEQVLDVQMVRWLMPSIIATSLVGVCTALLNANHRFVGTALTFVTGNLVTIAVVIASHRTLGIFALVLGTLMGFFAQLFVQVPFILRYGLYRFEFDAHHPGLGKTWASLLLSFVATSAVQINLSFDRYFASTLSAGSTAAMGYTTKLAYMPQIVVTALGAVIFPLIAHQFAASDRAGMRRNIGLALRMTGFFMIPCAAGLSALAYPIVQTLFERDAFGPSATALCASFIPFACISLLATSYTGILWRACLACQEIRKATTISVAAVALNVAVSAASVNVLGVRGLLLANGIAGFFLAVCQARLLRRLIGGLDWKSLLFSTSRVCLAAFTMVGVISEVRTLGIWAALPEGGGATYLASLLVIGAFVYLCASRLLGVEELGFAAKTLKRRFARRFSKPADVAEQ